VLGDLLRRARNYAHDAVSACGGYQMQAVIWLVTDVRGARDDEIDAVHHAPRSPPQRRPASAAHPTHFEGTLPERGLDEAST